MRKESKYELNHVQLGMCIQYQLTNDVSENVIQKIYEIEGNINHQIMEQATQLLVKKNEALGIRICKGGIYGFLQYFVNGIDFMYEQLSGEEQIEEQVERIATEERKRGFDLLDQPLIRFRFIQCKENHYKFIWTYHHIVMDDSCIVSLWKDLFELYSQLIETSKEVKDSPVVSIKEYCTWYAQQDFQYQLDYWKELLAEYDNIADITYYGEVSKKQEGCQQFTRYISKDFVEKLKWKCNKLGIEFSTILEYAWGIVLQRYNRCNDVVFGRVSFDRGLEQYKDLVGTFVSTTPLRLKIAEKMTIGEALLQLQMQKENSKKNQNCSLSAIQGQTELSNHLINSILLVSDESELERCLEYGSKYMKVKFVKSTMHPTYPINLYALIKKGQLEVNFIYDCKKYPEKQIQRLFQQMEKVLYQVEENISIECNKVDILLDEEKECILHRYNDTFVEYPTNQTIIELLEQQVDRKKEQTALVFGDKKLSYTQFNEKVNCVAYELRSKGIGVGDKVPIIAERSLEMIIGIYGILKSGAAYVPIDKDYPQERIQYIIENCQAKLVVVYRAEYSGELEKVDLESEHIWNHPKENPNNINCPEDIAYIIYTSGTTGKPKGVMLRHSGVVAMRYYLKRLYQVQDTDCVLQFANYVFDASVWEMTISLLNGASLVLIATQDIMDVDCFNQYVEEKHISICLLPPQFYMQTKIQGLKVLTTGGSAAGYDLVARAVKENARYINAYGPTENTVVATHWEAKSQDCIPKHIPIGQPIDNSKIYIMNGDSLCGIGIPGEICITGAGVAKGYLNQQELTEKMFTINPYDKMQMYHTGDIGVWCEDGTILYLGRIDEQVKIRGYRIELLEIEDIIRGMQNIQDVTVVTQKEEDGQEIICAYVVSSEKIDLEWVKENLSKKLPQYMIPTRMMQIPEIPINKSGKVAKHALKRIELKKEACYTEPRTANEKIICQVFEEILGIKQVGIQDSFIGLGGDSIKAIRIVSRIHSLGYDIRVRSILEKSIVEKIAIDLEKKQQEEYCQGEVVGTVEETPILSIFRKWSLKKPHHFNQDLLIEIDNQSKEEVEKIIDAFVRHHDILRAVYREHTLQILDIESTRPISIKEIHCGEVDIHESQELQDQCTKIQASIDLQQGPLIAGAIIYSKDKKYLFLCIHHLIIDGVSWRILIDDYNLARKQQVAKEEIHLPAKTASFIEWSKALIEFRQDNQMKQEEKYWDSIEEQLVTLAKEQNIEEKLQQDEYKKIEFTINHVTTDQLIHKANFAYSTEINDLLLSALTITMGNLFHREKISITLEGHGREEIHKPICIDRTVGWFTIMYPVILTCYADMEKTIIETKETLHKVPSHGIGYGVLGNENVDLSLLSFNYLGEFQQQQSEQKIELLQYGVRNAKENGYFSNLSLTGQLINGELCFSVQYNERYYDTKWITRLVEGYKRALEEVGAFCVNRDKSVLTPSDYGVLDLSYDDLQRLRMQYGEIDAIYSLAPLQQGILFQSMFSDRKTEYFIQNIFHVYGTIEEIRIKKALELLTVKYPVIKTAFVYQGVSAPKQFIVSNRAIEYSRIDIDSLDNVQIEQIARKDLERGFDLEQDSLFRVYAIFLKDRCVKMIWSFHHIIMDGWCLSLIFGDFIKFCDGETEEERSLQLGTVKSTYEDYIHLIEKQNREAAIQYWKGLLNHYNNFNTVEPLKEETGTYQVGTKRIHLSKELTGALIALSSEQNCTMNSMIELAWGILLQAYTHTNDVVFGKIVSGRNINLSGIEQLVGLFSNSIPVRVQFNIKESFLDVLQRIQKQGLDSEEFSYITLAEIQAVTTGKEPLIHNLLVLENYMEEEATYLKGQNWGMELEHSREQTNYDLNLIAGVKFGQIYLELMYNTKKYCEQEITLLLEHLECIFQQASKNLNLPIQQYEVITEEERYTVLEQFNQTDVPYDETMTIVKLFEEQVERQRDKTALVYYDRSMTYMELNKGINQVAHSLRDRGVLVGDMIPIIAKRGFAMIQGIYGILKAGAAYVPIDPEYPIERIRYVIQDCHAKLVLVTGLSSTLKEQLSEQQIMDLDDDVWSQSVSNLPIVNQIDDPAYVIYTSGTSGKPKGVLLKHRGVVAMRQYLKDLYQVDTNDRVLQFANYVFDASVWEMTIALLNGATLVLISNEDILNIQRFNQYTKDTKISLTLLPPQYYLQSNIKNLRVLTTGGSAASLEVIQKAIAENERYINAYGPTENTVLATHWEYLTTDKGTKRIPIGKPISNSKIYILNGDALCGIGIPGEICITGAGVAEGYINQEKLTQEKFVTNPFGTGKMYRTGDLGKWNLDGDILYLGRVDKQVKIHGYRVELMEIESVLRSFVFIQDVTVIARTTTDAKQEICAYLVSEEKLDMSEIREQLMKQLPHYMIPTKMLQIDRIPVNQSGKVDENALPEIKAQWEEQYEKPENERQRILCTIFAEVLSVEKVGMHDSFFALGGHSLYAIRLVNLIQEKLQCAVSVKDIFLYDTVKKLDSFMEQQEVIQRKKITPVGKQDTYLMSDIEQQIYVASCLDETKIQYNIPQVFEVIGKIEKERLRHALELLVEQHEVLRTEYLVENGQYVRRIREHIEIDMEEITVEDSMELEQFHEYVKAFSLEQAPLFRIRLIESGKKNYIMFDFHHIICDGRSMEIFLTQLSQYYDGKKMEKSFLQYKDFAHWYHNRDTSMARDYWRKHLQTKEEVSHIQTDFPNSYGGVYFCDHMEQQLDMQLFSRIKEVSMDTACTEYIILLSVLGLMLSEYTLGDHTIIGTPVSGRMDKEVEDMLGVFINVLPIYILVDQKETFLQYLHRVRETCMEAFAHQDYPYEKIMQCTDGSQQGLFHILFSYLQEQQDMVYLGETVCRNLHMKESVSKYELQFVISEKQSNWYVEVLYCKEIYKQSTIQRMIQQFQSILNSVLEQPTRCIEELEIATEYEKKLICNNFNDTFVAYEKTNVVELYRKQVLSKKDQVVIIEKDKEYTYGEFDHIVQNIVSILETYDVKPNSFVALIAERKVEMIAGIFAVLIAGAAYVPIDSNYPKERIDYVLGDCKPALVLVTEGISLMSEYPVVTMKKENVMTKVEKVSRKEIQEEDLAYCIYTSGTTGNPKGVMIQHKSLYNSICCFYDEFVSTDRIYTPLFTNYAFDLTVPTIYLPLCYGGILDLIEEDKEVDFQYILSRGEYTFFKMTPSHLKLMLGCNHKTMAKGATVVVGGEFLHCETANTFLSRYGKEAALINEYGPTEATVGATIYPYDAPENGGHVKIGRPLANTQIYILSNNKLCGIGPVGEICIAGTGVAKGYLHCQELQKEKFVENPFGPGYLYRTGDLGRWMEDGTIECLGRTDDQVKINGHRIEIGDIETAIAQMEEVEDVVVIHRENKLLAYYIAKNKLTEKSIRRYLEKSLPAYMIPLGYMQLEKMPLTFNGKVNKTLLPTIMIEQQNNYIAPENEMELALCETFQEILKCDHVGMQDSFFELGGDSIKAIQISSKMQEKGYHVSVKDIMGQYKLQKICNCITVSETQWQSKGVVSGKIEPTPIIKEFFMRKLPVPEHYHQDVFLCVSGYSSEEVRNAIHVLIEHHEMLRAVCRENTLEVLQGDVKQFYEYKEYENLKVDSSDLYVDEICLEIQRSFDLYRGPLVKAAYLNCSNGKYVFLCIHHLIVDSISFQILIEDFYQALECIKAGKQVNFLGKTASFIEWTQVLAEYEEGEELEKQKAYWSYELEHVQEGLIPLDSMESRGIEKIEFTMDQDETRKILYETAFGYGTRTSDLLVTALGKACYDTWNQQKLVILMESHGRELLHRDIPIGRTVGWFTNRYPIMIDTLTLSLEDCFIQTKDKLHRVPNNGIGYGLLYEFQQSQVPSIQFNYLGEIDEGNDKICGFSSRGESISRENGLLCPIDINIYVLNQKLEYQVYYDSSKLSKELASTFVYHIQVRLQQLTELCMSKTERIKTASDFTDKNLLYSEWKEIQSKIPLEQIQDIYPLTSLQEGMLFHNLVGSSTSEYIVQHVFSIQDNWLQENIFDAVQFVVDRHDALRTRIIYENLEKPRQIVLKEQRMQIASIEVDAFDEVYQEIMESERKHFSDMLLKPLLRVAYINCGTGGRKMIWTYHHIIMDGWCSSILFSDFTRYHSMLQEGMPYEAVKEYVREERSKCSEYGEYVDYILSKSLKQAGRYWEELLAQYDEVAEFKHLSNLDHKTNSIRRERRMISEELSAQVFKVSRDNGITVNTCTEVMCGLVLAEYGRSQDVVFGKVVSGRNHRIKGIDDIIGLFINTIPVRIQICEEEQILNILQRVQKQGIESNQYSYYPLAEIQKATEQKRDLIKVLYAFENYYEKENDSSEEFQFEMGREQTNYSISISISIIQSQIAIDILFDEEEYDEKEIQLILAKMEFVLEKIVNGLHLPIGKLCFTTEEEQNVICLQFNKKIEWNHSNETIVTLLEEMVEKYSDETAILSKTGKLTYDQFNQKVNCVAHRLREMEVGPGDLVSIIAQRGIEMLIGIYGIIKAGAAYVPIDPEYPEERIQYIIKDCNAKVIVVYKAQISINSKKLDLEDYSLWSGKNTNPKPVNTSTDIAYVIYTSGTSGKPKGVMLQHKGVVNMRYYLRELYQVDKQDRILQFANYVFDASVWEMTIALLNGAKLVLIEKEDILDVNQFDSYVRQQGITITLLPPQYYMQTAIRGLKVLTTGGSAANKELVLRAVKENQKYINAYGPTESTVLATHWAVDQDSCIPDIIPIGVPMKNAQLYIMNGDQMCGIGVPGELCIVGEGIAHGYLNQRELTEEKFIANPLGDGRMYRTGDLARWNIHGYIEYMGRIDQQVKIRGFRIELLEIESVIRTLNAIEEVAVIAREYEEGEKQIGAYLVSHTVLDLEDVKLQLSKLLPDYMIPSRMMQIEQIPINQSGKVNEKALPDILLENQKSYLAPESIQEKQVCKAFEEVLSVKQIGKRDSFFALGGDSIKAIRIVSKIREMGYDISVRDIMDKYTVEQIAATLMESGDSNPYEQGEVVGEVEETPIFTMFKNWNFANKDYFNQDVMIELEEVSLEDISTVLKALALHHDMLRAVYRNDKLVILAAKENKLFQLEEYHCRMNGAEGKQEVHEECTRIHASMNIEDGPLMKGAIIYTEDKKYLFLCIHHFVVDGISWRVLLEDYETAMRQKKEGKRIQFPKKTASFQEWSHALQEYKHTLVASKENEYWRSIQSQVNAFCREETFSIEQQEKVALQYPVEQFAFPQVKHNIIDKEQLYGQVEYKLDKSLTQQLLYETNKAYGTEIQEILLCSLAMAYYTLTDKNHFVVGLEGHGREEIHVRMEVDRTVGWFTTMYPVSLFRAESIEENIIETKETLRKIPNRGIGYGLLYKEGDAQPEISFNYLGKMDEAQSKLKVEFLQNGQSTDSRNRTNALLSISILEVDETLVIKFTYVSERWNADFVKLFLQEYVTELKKCINNCMEQEETVKTISDMDADDLSEEDLDFITSLLE